MLGVQGLRKAELHCHIDGLLDHEMAQQLAADPEPLTIDPVAFEPIRSLDHWLTNYRPLVERATHPADRWLPRLLELHLARLRTRHDVVYTEIFVSSLLFARDEESELVELFADLRRRALAAAGPDLEVELVLCIGRGPESKIAAQMPRITWLRRAGLIRGVALAGLEEKFPLRPLERFFDEFRDLGLGIEIHAGELAGADSVRDALQYGHPDRLGHAIAAFTDDALLAEIMERDIHLEFCPSSNLALGCVRTIEQHPISRARELEMSFSINTDDPGPFRCSLTSEMDLVARTFGFDETDFAAIFANTMRASFRNR